MAAGFENRGGLAREAIVYGKVWPSVTTGTLTALLPFTSEDLDDEFTQATAITRDTTPGFTPPIVTERSAAGNVNFNLAYQGMELLFALALGHEPRAVGGIDLPEEVVAGEVYRHLFEVDDHLDAKPWRFGQGFMFGQSGVGGDDLIFGQRKMRRATWVQDKGVGVWETQSAMVSQMILTADPRNVQLSVGFLGYRTHHFALNNPDITGLICESNRALFHDMVIRVGPVDAVTELDSTDDIQPGLERITLQINNNINGIPTKDTGKFIDEPRRVNSVQIGGGFTIPTYAAINNLFQDWFQDSIELMMTVDFVGEEIPPSTGEFYRITYFFPSITLTGESIPTSGPGRVSQSYTFIANKPSVDPAGFPDNTFASPLMVEMLNKESTHPLL